MVGEKSQIKSKLDFTIRVGEENKYYSESLLKNFPYAGNQIVSVVLGFKCQNSDAAKEKFDVFFLGIIDLVLNMVPDDVSQTIAVFQNDLKIEYKALPEELLVRFYINNELTENEFVAYRLISEIFIQENSSISICLKLQFAAGLVDIGALPNENIINWIAKGFSTTLDAIISNDLMECSVYGQYIKSQIFRINNSIFISEQCKNPKSISNLLNNLYMKCSCLYQTKLIYRSLQNKLKKQTLMNQLVEYHLLVIN